MRCVITGHTTGIGKILYIHFKNLGWEVIGLSRNTGYDLTQDLTHVKEIVAGADLFINNACAGRCQIELLNPNVPTIVMGSIAADYDLKSEYSIIKKELASKCKEISLLPTAKIVHLKISMLEDALSTDVGIEYKDVVAFIDFWLQHPTIANVDYELKLTEYTKQKIKENLNFSV